MMTHDIYKSDNKSPSKFAKYLVIYMGPTVYGKPGKGREFDFGIQGLKKVWNLVKILFRSGNLTLALKKCENIMCMQ